MRLPLPADLLAAFEAADATVTIAEFATRYDSDTEIVRRHLKIAANRRDGDGTTLRKLVLQRQNASRAAWRDRVFGAATKDAVPRCSRCKILLVMVPHDGEKCCDCLGIEARYRDVVPYEYVPEVTLF